MASPGNQHCANCIGTLSFPIGKCALDARSGLFIVDRFIGQTCVGGAYLVGGVCCRDNAVAHQRK